MKTMSLTKSIAVATLSIIILPTLSHAQNLELKPKTEHAASALCRYSYANTQSTDRELNEGTKILVELAAEFLSSTGQVYTQFASGIWGRYDDIKPFSQYRSDQKAAAVASAVAALDTLKQSDCKELANGKPKDELILESADQWSTGKDLNRSLSTYYKTVKGFRKFVTLPKVAQEFFIRQDSDLGLMLKLYKQSR